MDSKEAFVITPYDILPKGLGFSLILAPFNKNAVMVAGSDKENFKKRINELIDKWWPKTE